MRIALDVMGGDRAPDEMLQGAVLAVEKGYVEHSDVILIGDEDQIKARCEHHPILKEFETRHFPEVVEMHESPVEALKRKRNASILGCVEQVRNGTARALVTAGHTGAAVGASTLGLRLLKGIRRAGLAVTYEGSAGPTTLIDVGANLTSRPIHLFQYGLMANHFVRGTLGIENPRIGILNVGAEDRKGNDLVRQTQDLFRGTDLNFVGNLEGQDLFRGVADVVVAEGFVGNVAVKVSEGLMEFLMGSLMKMLRSRSFEPGTKEAELATEWMSAIRQYGGKIDYSEHGGALLLGVDGIVLIGHGRSEAKAVANALRVARRFAEAEVNQHIVEGVRHLQS